MTNPAEARFDVNELEGVTLTAGMDATAFARFPDAQALTVEQYADAFAPVFKSQGVEDYLQGIMKAGLGDTPSMQTFGQLTTLSGNADRGLVPWPDLPPQVLRKLAGENLIIHAVIQQRSLDVDRYAGLSSHPWKPGWTIEVRNRLAKTERSDLQDIQDAARFIENCNSQTGYDARARDAAGVGNFRTYLKEITRDSLRFDLAATWTQCDTRGRVEAFKALPGSNIILATPQGYNGQKPIWAVGVDEAGTVRHEFTRDQLSVMRRNPRTDPNAVGYGYSELNMTVKVIQAFTNAFDMNADTFTRSAVPNGVLMGEGLWTPRQTEVLSRMWQNLKKGVTKQWALPFINLPKDGKLEILDLSRIKGNEVYYEDFINMMGGLYCAIVGFEPARLGYRISGGGPDASPKSDTTSGVIVDQADPGLAGLLEPIEEFVNAYLIWPRWPHLILRFNGKNPKEDARAYEFKRNASTYGEARAMSDLPSLVDLAKGEQKKMAQMMELCPIDPGLTSVYQTILQGVMAAEAQANEPEPGPGAPDVVKNPKGAKIAPKKDPAKSEAHGHTSGVRRDSKAEAKKSVGYTKPLYVQRKVLNAEEILRWAAQQGFTSTLPADDLHVTVAFSREPVDWFAAPAAESSVMVPAGGARAVMPLGHGEGDRAIVLRFDSFALQVDWRRFVDAGASWDYEGFSPHFTITYANPDDLDLDAVEPYRGEIVLGPELFSALDTEWREQVELAPTA